MKKMNEKEYPELIKWPGFVVLGKSVSKEQAAEIILRTDSYYFSTNDRAWDKTCKEILEYPKDEDYDKDDFRSKWDDIGKWGESIGNIPLEYLDNSWIGSAYIGGPHGWCDWDGNIGCHYGNIGKWPSVKDVKNDWKAIADAFPFLNLECQLYDAEMGELGAQPIVHFIVKDGNVEVYKPDCVLKPDVYGTKSGSEAASMITLVTGAFGRERGCTEEQLKMAFDICLEKFGEKLK